MDVIFIRDTVLKNLKNDRDLNGMVFTEINGNYFSAVDIALPGNDGNPDVYRIAVVKHNQQNILHRKR